jgi:hypothetical protein
MTWRKPQPPPPDHGPNGRIAKALRNCDNARSILGAAERELAFVVTELVAPPIRSSFIAFRQANGITAEQWEAWHRSYSQDQRPKFRLLVPEPS